jgi:hypothetical protein
MGCVAGGGVGEERRRGRDRGHRVGRRRGMKVEVPMKW